MLFLNNFDDVISGLHGPKTFVYSECTFTGPKKIITTVKNVPDK